MEDGIHSRIIYGKVKPKLIADYRGAGLFSHIILNRKVEPLLIADTRNRPFLTSQNICSETQFKIQHINREMEKKKVL